MSEASKRVVVLKTGCTAQEVRAIHGDYDRWFQDAMADEGLALEFRDVTRSDAGDLESCSGVLITGSPASVCLPGDWMESLSASLRRAAASGRPVLGVCFGAQILAHAFGGSVVRNPRGWEIGGIRVRLTEAALADPLFAGLPREMGALATHEDHIERLPEGATLLGSNESAPVQAFRIGRMTWGVQFHPEITPGILEILIRLRRGILEEDAERLGRQSGGHVDGLLSTLREPGAGEASRLLRNFARLVRQS